MTLCKGIRGVFEALNRFDRLPTPDGSHPLELIDDDAKVVSGAALLVNPIIPSFHRRLSTNVRCRKRRRARRTKLLSDRRWQAHSLAALVLGDDFAPHRENGELIFAWLNAAMAAIFNDIRVRLALREMRKSLRQRAFRFAAHKRIPQWA